jgi:hypothetical protein
MDLVFVQSRQADCGKITGRSPFTGGDVMRIDMNVAIATNLRRALMALAAAVLLAGCAAAPLVEEADRAKIRKVVIAVADFPPNIEMRIQTQTQDQTQTSGTSAFGKVQAAVEEEMTRRLKASELRDPLIAALRRELTTGDFEASVLPRSEVRTSAEDRRPAYKPQAKDVDAVLEVSLRSIVMVGAGRASIMTRGSNELLASLGAIVQVRLIDAKDQRVMGNLGVRQFSGYVPLEDWIATRGGQMDEGLEQMNRRLAADIVDLALREYTPPEPGTDGEVRDPAPTDTPELALPPGTFSPYRIDTLRPVSLPTERSNTLNNRRPRYGSRGAFTPITADSNRPSLEWERFPRGYAWAPETADAARISGVTYEVRLYNALRRYVSGGPVFLSPERVIYERAGLAQPAHQPETELEPCHVYFWSARARFELDGRVRVTPWMSVGVPRSALAFATPPASGNKRDCFYGN